LNRDNSLAWRETLHATNPCGEQPLPAHGSCCLGSIDLSRLVRQPFTDRAHFDDAGLSALATTAVRMLDNVIDLTSWPLEEQRLEALQTRRIGLGFTGLADTLMMLGLRYDRTEGRAQAAHIARLLRDSAVQASVDLARERGSFPCFDAARHLSAPGFASRLPVGLRQAIAQHGLRNSHLLSVAPAGSISLAMADNVASGIEPAWAWHTVRPVHRSDGSVEPLSFANHAWRLYRAQQASPAGRRASPDGEAEAEANADADANHKDDDNTVALPAAFLTADDISPWHQLVMAEAVAPFIDAAISKTVLLPPDATPALVDRLLRHAWRQGLKGVAVYRPNPVITPLIQPVATCPV
jgi:ribonucleoside-diphosphate reductase alpha chain